jgi:hypothetical protein
VSMIGSPHQGSFSAQGFFLHMCFLFGTRSELQVHRWY